MGYCDMGATESTRTVTAQGCKEIAEAKRLSSRAAGGTQPRSGGDAAGRRRNSRCAAPAETVANLQGLRLESRILSSFAVLRRSVASRLPAAAAQDDSL